MCALVLSKTRYRPQTWFSYFSKYSQLSHLGIVGSLQLKHVSSLVFWTVTQTFCSNSKIEGLARIYLARASKNETAPHDDFAVFQKSTQHSGWRFRKCICIIHFFSVFLDFDSNTILALKTLQPLSYVSCYFFKKTSAESRHD
jgi:hypothetical protein